MEHLLQADHSIAENIIRIRKEQKLSQYVIAARLQAMGLNYSRSRLSMIERKQRPIPANLIVGLAIIFQCDYDDLLNGLRNELLEGINKTNA